MLAWIKVIRENSKAEGEVRATWGSRLPLALPALTASALSGSLPCAASPGHGRPLRGRAWGSLVPCRAPRGARGLAVSKKSTTAPAPAGAWGGGALRAPQRCFQAGAMPDPPAAFGCVVGEERAGLCRGVASPLMEADLAGRSLPALGLVPAPCCRGRCQVGAEPSPGSRGLCDELLGSEVGRAAPRGCGLQAEDARGWMCQCLGWRCRDGLVGCSDRARLVAGSVPGGCVELRAVSGSVRHSPAAEGRWGWQHRDREGAARSEHAEPSGHLLGPWCRWAGPCGQHPAAIGVCLRRPGGDV